MARLILLGFFVVLVIASGLVIKSCQNMPAQKVEVAADGQDSGIVALPDGATMVAKQGTVGRELVDWLASDERSRSFELGGQEFLGRSADPTMESKVRLLRLVAMLKANPEVKIHIVGHSDKTNDPAADQTLSEARALMVVRGLEEGGISQSRISFAGRGGEEPIDDDHTPQGRARNQRVSITLTRGP